MFIKFTIIRGKNVLTMLTNVHNGNFKFHTIIKDIFTCFGVFAYIATFFTVYAYCI